MTTKNRQRNDMAAAADVMGDQAKMDAYVSNVMKRVPKRDRRDLSRASAQTKWIMEAVTEWWNFQQGGGASGMGLPTQNVLYRAGLMLPHSPMQATTPDLQDIPKRVTAVGRAIGQLMPSRSRVMLAWERHGDYGTEYCARKLRMSPSATERYLRQARQSVADILRGMGFSVPLPEESEKRL